jgi:hypothetical protein
MKALYKQLKMQYIINPRSALCLQQRGGGGEDGLKNKLRLPPNSDWVMELSSHEKIQGAS